MGQRTSVYLDDDLHAAVEASGVPLAELIRRGLASDGLPAHVTNGPSVTAALLAAIPPGEPCPASPAPGRDAGTRDTARYGLRRMVLCIACAAAPTGQAYRREVPESAARAVRRGAA